MRIVRDVQIPAFRRVFCEGCMQYIAEATCVTVSWQSRVGWPKDDFHLHNDCFDPWLLNWTKLQIVDGERMI